MDPRDFNKLKMASLKPAEEKSVEKMNTQIDEVERLVEQARKVGTSSEECEAELVQYEVAQAIHTARKTVAEYEKLMKQLRTAKTTNIRNTIKRVEKVGTHLEKITEVKTFTPVLKELIKKLQGRTDGKKYRGRNDPLSVQ